ncbi:41077_t:CDS:1, partial [Gigaspora margarita]
YNGFRVSVIVSLFIAFTTPSPLVSKRVAQYHGCESDSQCASKCQNSGYTGWANCLNNCWCTCFNGGYIDCMIGNKCPSGETVAYCPSEGWCACYT